MIHFFPTYAKDAADSPFGQALRAIGTPHRIIAGAVDMRYRSRWRLAFVCLPRLAWFALRAAVASLVLSRPAPDAVVLGSDIEVLVFALVRAVAFRRRVRIVLASFIFTARADPRLHRLRLAWFRWLLRRTDLVAVHSRLEVETYRQLFAGTRFVFVPWGTTIAMRDELRTAPPPPPDTPYIVSAGRSGRDYRTLAEAVRGQGIETRIICDYAATVADITPSREVKLLTACHGRAYIEQLHGALAVVIPLAIEDISAGQMVLVQSKGLGKAIIVTDSPTIRDYVTEDDAVLVPRGDAVALRAAIRALVDDPAARVRLGRNALAAFERGYTTEHSVRRLMAAIADHGPTPQTQALPC
jgi:glycosyltransferase involved in cell wall biosynthesis